MASVMTRRLMAELKGTNKQMQEGQLPWLLACSTVDDNLMKWTASMTFPEESELQKSLNSYAAHRFDESQNKLTFQVRFTPEYPMIAPEIWLNTPRLKYARGSSITFGGRVCIQMLTSSAWNPTTKMADVFREVQSCLLSEGATVDTSGVIKPYLEPPPMLERLATTAYPTANDFQVDGVQVLSPFEAGPFFGNLDRVEATDKIALSMQHGRRIYEGARLQTPLMFEVKTQRGRKTHCGIFDFMAGLPDDICILPKWVMDDIGIKERDVVRVRGVALDLIQHVKVQPHSIDFYHAVQQSGNEPAVLLTETLRRFSALTEDTSIPIEIGSEVHSIQIVELRPKAAVRIIDTDVVNDFEFKVETEFAPNLESEEDKKAREEEILAHEKARRLRREEELAEGKDRREKAIRRHFERARDAAKKEAGSTDGKDGNVSVRLSFPGGSHVDAKFPDGASAVAIMAFVLASEWADERNPWSVRLLCNFPRRCLTNEDRVTTEMNRSVVSVHEELPPAADEEVLQVVGAEDKEEKEVANFSPLSRTFSADRSTDLGRVVDDDPGLDEAALQAQTLKMFEVQRFIQTGIAPQEALFMVEAGMTAPTSASAVGSRSPPAPSFVPPQRRQRRAEPPRTDLQQIIDLTGVDDATAQRLLEENAGDVQRACNAFFDSM